MQTDALDGKLRWKRGRVWTFLRPMLNGLVGNEPDIASATVVFPKRMRPTFDITLVRVGDPDGQTVEGRCSFQSEVEHILVAVIQKAGRIDRFEMSVGTDLSVPLNRDGLDPMNGVLQLEQSTQAQRDFKGQQSISGRTAEIKEEGAVWFEHTRYFATPGRAPVQVIVGRPRILVHAVPHSYVVGRRSHNQIHRFGR